MRKALLFIVIIVLAAGCAGSNEAAPRNTTAVSPQQNADLSGAVTFRMEAWADNWFAAYLGDRRIVEDSVSITTERSFNAETVEFLYWSTRW